MAGVLAIIDVPQVNGAAGCGTVAVLVDRAVPGTVCPCLKFQISPGPRLCYRWPDQTGVKLSWSDAYVIST